MIRPDNGNKVWACYESTPVPLGLSTMLGKVGRKIRGQPAAGQMNLITAVMSSPIGKSWPGWGRSFWRDPIYVVANNQH